MRKLVLIYKGKNMFLTTLKRDSKSFVLALKDVAGAFVLLFLK